jgi:hypothetical protein
MACGFLSAALLENAFLFDRFHQTEDNGQEFSTHGKLELKIWEVEAPDA